MEHLPPTKNEQKMLNVIHLALLRHKLTITEIHPYSPSSTGEAFTKVEYKGVLEGIDYTIGKVYDDWKIHLNTELPYTALLIGAKIAS